MSPLSLATLACLACPDCAGRLASNDADGSASVLACTRCKATFPIVNGIPRFVHALESDTAKRTQASFGYEWTHFNDWSQSGETNFNDYFEGIDRSALGSCMVLDAGCGMGRHARQIAPFCSRVVAVDFSRAIEQAHGNTAGLGNVDCVQADLLALPFGDGVFDFAYSLGVLHHLDETSRALRRIVATLRPGGRLRIYLYWKKHGWQGRVLGLATGARRLTTRMPFAVLRGACAVLSIGLFGAVVVPYRLLSAAGVRSINEWPLFVYSRYPFNVLYNDQFDRFSAPIEKRYDPDEIRALLTDAGLVNISIRPCFGWIADATKPA